MLPALARRYAANPISLVLAGALLLCGARPLPAQDAARATAEAVAIVPLVSVQLRAGSTIPAGGFTDRASGWEGDGGEALSWGATLTVSRGGIVNPYVGIGQHRYSCDAATCGSGRELTLSGFDLGTRIFPLGRGRWAPWLRLGAVRYATEATGPGMSDEEAGGGSWGVEAGAGLDVHLTGKIFVSPGARWIRIDGDLPSGDLRLRTFVVDVGVVLGF